MEQDRTREVAPGESVDKSSFQKGIGNSSEGVWVLTCFSCGIKGHKADQCPNKRSRQGKVIMIEQLR